MILLQVMLAVTMQAQKFLTGTLVFANGNKIQCQLVPPKDFNTKEIRYRLNSHSPVNEVPSDSLTYISVELGKGINFDFQRLATAWDLDKKPSKKAWLLIVVPGYATLYMKSEYDFDYEEGVAVITHFTLGRSLPSFDYYLKKKGMEFAVFFSKTSNSPGMLGLHNILKKSVNKYLSDDPDLVAKVDEKTYSHRDSEEIIRLYNQFTGIR